VRLRRLLALAVELGLRGRRNDVRLAGFLVSRPVRLWEGAAKGEVGWSGLKKSTSVGFERNLVESI